MFRVIYTYGGPYELFPESFETEALAEAKARESLETTDVISVIVLRPIAEFHITKTITMKEWKQMLKDQADG